MKRSLFALCLLAAWACTPKDLPTDTPAPAAEKTEEEFRIPEDPEAEEDDPGEEPGDGEVSIPQLDARVVNVESPKMKIYFPATQGRRCRIVVACPGGGYSSIPGADGYEGAYYKDLFNAEGYALAVLYYTLPNGDRSKPIGDLESAIRLIRSRADEWYVDSGFVGVMGFSAGGHLASTIATHSTGLAKPDFQVLFYPVISMESGKTHAGSLKNFLGENPADNLVALYSNDRQVRSSTPRVFLAYAESDNVVPPAYNGAAYYDALTDAGVPVVRYTYSGTRHGWHWGSFLFDGVQQSDGTKYENLDDVKSKLSVWLRSF